MSNPIRPTRLALAVALVTALVASMLLAFSVSPAAAAVGCGAAANPVVCENALPGTSPNVWDIDGAGDSSIQGFSTDISANVGTRINFKVDTSAAAYTVAIYRSGYYQGLGARFISDVSSSVTNGQNQPECITDAASELYDCGNWAVSAFWNVPSDAASGVYFALLHRTDTGGESHITFVVRNEASHSAVLFQTSDPTWQAYNTYGGSDFYQGAANGRAYKISYNRPVVTRQDNSGRDFYYSNEYPMVRFLEQNGYDVSYFSGVDTDRLGSKLKNHQVFLSVGHDEYWSGAQRANVEAARDAGVNLQFLSGNEVYWRTRYAPSSDSSATPYRTIVSYKETWNNDKIDPSTEWTGTWRDPRYASSAQGAGTPENALTGTMYQSNFSDLPITVSAAEGKTRLWRNTSLTSLATGTTAALAAHTIGYESNEDIDNGFRPAGLIRLSTTVGAVPEYLRDFGNTVTPGTTTHHLTLYRAASGALVFSAGTVQWAWGLDQNHDGTGVAADSRMRQAQVNLLADMGAQPATLASGLVAVTASTDSTAPTVIITSPVANASIPHGTAVTVTGTAADVGGMVAGVEVSTDGGSSWHPASGTASWNYSYLQQGMAAQNIRVRATDDSANTTATPVSRAITVTGPYTVFGTQVPSVSDSGDSDAVEVGLQFTPSQTGYVSGVRFYKSQANTGTHTGSLWSPAGVRLANTTFAGETASGWQTATFTQPVQVTAGTKYTVSYSAPNGHYAVTASDFAYRGIIAAPLTVAGGFGAAKAAVYNTTAGQYPTDSYGLSNYFVDAVFTSTDASPLVATGQAPLPGSSSVPAGSAISAVLSKDVVASSIAFAVTDQLGAPVPGTVGYTAATRTAVFTPSAALNGFVTYAVVLSATATSGGSLTAGQNWSFTTVRPPAAAGDCPCGVFTDATTPTTLQIADNAQVTLGVRFTSSVDGTISGIRFYKSQGNTGTHTGTLWSSTGTALATATFTGESTSGWQTATFATPVAITAGSQYVASYLNPLGTYSASSDVFPAGGVVRGPLTGIVGTYTYANAFPTNQVPTSYLVDVIFNRAAAAIAIVSQTPASGAIDVNTAAAITVQLSVPINPGYSLTATSGSTTLPGTTTLSTDGTTLTFTPASPLPAGTTIGVRLDNVTSTQGSALSTRTWSFATAPAPGQVTTTYTMLGNETPAVTAATDDSSAVELGMSFTASVAGAVTAIRFFKGAGNTGPHTGSLWSASGTRLATVTFSNETATGWQSAILSTPVSLTPGQTYVVSYLAPVGHYAYSSGYFALPKTSGPLTAGTEANGRYLYGAGGFPTYSWNQTNYFVDVAFTAAAP